MTKGRRKLREELNQLTIPPPEVVGREGVTKWLDCQIRNIEELRQQYSHRIKAHESWSDALTEVNCYMHAFDMLPEHIKEWRYLEIQPDSRFVCYLLEAHLIEKDIREAAAGDVVMYFDAAGTPMHAGKYVDGLVISKWGTGCTHVWEHGLLEVPLDYGNIVRVFRPISQDQAVETYIEWAKTKW